MEDPAATHDDLAQSGGPEDDPFAEIPSEPLTGPPTEGPIDVQEGDLRQYAVEDAQAGDGGGEPAAAEEPEFLQEPEETEAGEPVAAEEPEPEPEPTPEPEPALPQNPPAEEPEPTTPEPESAPPEPEPEPEPTPTDGAGGDPATPVESSGIPPSGESLTPEEPPVEEGGESEPGETPEPEPEKPKAKRRKRRSRKKEVPGRRGYVILKVGAVTAQHPERPVWEEAFERELPIGDPNSEPVVIDARSGELALRNAYRKLTDNGEGSYTLVAVPQKLFKPKSVEGKVPDSALAIKVG